MTSLIPNYAPCNSVAIYLCLYCLADTHARYIAHCNEDKSDETIVTIKTFVMATDNALRRRRNEVLRKGSGVCSQ